MDYDDINWVALEIIDKTQLSPSSLQEEEPEPSPVSWLYGTEPDTADDYELEPVYNVYNTADEEEEEEENVNNDSDVGGGRGMTAVALYDYEADEEDELNFDPDDIITNIEQIDEGWWMGECHGRTGVFPANYVELQK